jgi:hypothetical protein
MSAHEAQRHRIGRGAAVTGGCLALACCVALPAAAQTRPRTQAAAVTLPPALDNTATASAPGDGQASVKDAWIVAATAWPTVNLANTANATASGCSNCSAIAAAFAIVTSSYLTSSVTADDTANTTAVGCQYCNVAAVAESWVIVNPTGIAAITPKGLQELAAIHAQLPALIANWNTPQAVTNGTNVVDDEIQDVLSEDVTISSPLPSLHADVRLGARPAVARGIAPLVDVRHGPAIVHLKPRDVIAENGYTIYHYGQISAPTPVSS